MRNTRFGFACLLWIAGVMAAAQTFRERINVELVRVELLATDGRGRFVADHHFHHIEISLERRGLNLRYRRGYRILDTRESLIEGAVNRLHVPADRNPLGVRFQLDSAGEENGLPVARITVAYPAPPEAGGSVSGAGDVSIIGMCAVRDGALSQPIDLSGRADRASLTDSTWLVRSGRVRLKPGAYRWSFAIRDERTGITSYLTFDRKLP